MFLSSLRLKKKKTIFLQKRAYQYSGGSKQTQLGSK